MNEFKAVLVVFENGETNPEVLDLVNINDESDRIMAAPDEFQVNEIISENDIILKECNMVDDHGFGTGIFAFKN